MTPSLSVPLVTGRCGPISRFAAGPKVILRLLPLASLCLANPVPVAVVQAQTGTTLVSNAGQTPVDPDSANIHAQLFTTGSHPGGYTLTTVDVYLATMGMDDVEVSIYSNNQHDEPGSSLYALTAPGTLTSGGFNSFTAPSGATLSPNTAYHVYVNSGDWWVGTVASTSEDDGIIGWSLADSWQWVSQPNDPWNDVTGALLTKITGADPRTDDETLISNAGQTPVDPDSANIHAQLFTTGSDAGGYRFTTVEVYLDTGPVVYNFGTDDVDVSIYSNNEHDEPGSSLYALTPPGTLANGAFNRFTAPPNAMLSPNTAYHVYVKSGDRYVGTVASTSEDDGILGWTLADYWQWVTEPNDPWNDVPGALLVKITNASAVPSRRPDPDPDPDPDPESVPTLPGASAVGLGMLLYGLARRALSRR